MSALSQAQGPGLGSGPLPGIGMLPLDMAQFHNVLRRVGGYLLDNYIVLTAWEVLPLILAMDTNFPDAPILAVLFMQLQTFSIILYRVVMHYRTGQTAGKMVLMTRVYSLAGQSISLRQSVLREIVPIITTIILTMVLLANNDQIAAFSATDDPAPIPVSLILSLAIGLLWPAIDAVPMLFNVKRRAIHDYIAGTLVVRDETERALYYRVAGSSVAAPALAFFTAPCWHWEPCGSLWCSSRPRQASS